ncbi:MAG: hypothetical protein ABJF11_07595 [Reichenbachiella sp.]|uniref:hypothetical protein n=1 Tax=Reichenbachiella sp. TaxID=2184521 RepID=UPI003266230D
MKYIIKSNFLLGMLAAVCIISTNVALGQEITEENLKEKRREFAYKKRRIIVNNDGLDIKKRNEDDVGSDFINKRISGLAGKQVDAISYCTGVLDSYTHKSNLSQLRVVNKLGTPYLSQELLDQGTDALEEVIKFGKSNQIDIFWSFRMNDTHDSGTGGYLSQWKQDHLDLLLGEKGGKFEYGGKAWAALNYEKRLVRNRVFDTIEEVVANYDIDGIELDFFKHLIYFEEPTRGEPATELQISLMTELIRDLRIMIDRYSIKKQKPILLLIKIPDSPEYAMALGLDYLDWMEKGYIDILISGDYFKLTPWVDFVAMARKYDVASFACLAPRRIHNGGKPGQKSDLLKWRGEAYGAWQAGVNGIYTFNRFSTWDKIFVEIGDPQKLKNLEREDQESFICEECWFKPQKWVKDGEKYLVPKN